MALPLPNCPIQKKLVIAKRVWLKEQIEKYLTEQKLKPNIGPSEFK